MAPKFFKDVHSGLNSKFTTRAFSLNLVKNDSTSNPNDSTNSLSDQSETSLQSLRVSSTSPSTGASSRFFGGNIDQNGDLSSTAGGKRTTHSNYILADSSIENTENMGISHDKNSVSVGRLTNVLDGNDGDDDDDDDLQITEIRELEEENQDDRASSFAEVDIKSQSGDQSSGDFLLEALSKSQKVCGLLKKQLETANSRVSNQEDELSRYKKSSETLRQAVKVFKERLDNLGIKSEEMRATGKASNETIQGLRDDCKNVMNSLTSYKQEVSSLKRKIDYLKQIKVSSSYEIEKRNKEIAMLQKKIDETSGYLSEQKIKNSSLEKTLQNCREVYDSQIKSVIEKSETSKADLLEKIELTSKSQSTEIRSLIKAEVSPLVGDFSRVFDPKVEKLCERFLKALDLTDSSISSQIVETHRELNQNDENLIKISSVILEKLEDSGKKHSNLIEKISQSEHHLQSILTGSTKGIELSSEVSKACEDIKIKIDNLDKDIKGYDLIRSDVEELRGLIENLNSELTSQTKKLGEREQELIESRKEIELFKSEEKRNKAESEQLKDDVRSLKGQIDLRDSKLRTLEEQLAKCKINCDSKLKTQMEVYKLVSEERDDFRKKFESKKDDLQKSTSENLVRHEETEREIDSLSKNYKQKLLECEKLQKLLKSLELENTKLKHDLKDMETSKKLKETTNVSNNYGEIPDGEHSTMNQSISKRKQTVKKVNKIVPLKPPITLNQNPSSNLGRDIKRKKLLDDDENFGLIFDDFDLDLLDDTPASHPVRYTRRKKTKI